MTTTLSNQPHKGETYYCLSLYKNNKHIGFHNGTRLTKKADYYVKDYIDMFIQELQEKCATSSIHIKILKKTF